MNNSIIAALADVWEITVAHRKSYYEAWAQKPVRARRRRKILRRCAKGVTALKAMTEVAKIAKPQEDSDE